MSTSEEVVAIVDERNELIGSATRTEMRVRRLVHRATYVLVFNSSGELFVQQRTAHKDVYPSYYDVAAGGVVLAGESYDESAAREVEEELGVHGAPQKPLFEFFHQDGDNRVWGAAYACTWDGPVRLQAEEVAWGAFLPVSRILEMAEREPFTPDGLEVLRRYLARKDLTP